MNFKQDRRQRLMAWMLVMVLMAPLSIPAQTRIALHKNSYSTSDDIKAGREAAAQVERQLPILNDYEATGYINRIGQRLVAAIPREYQHPEFRYTFKVVNTRDINAFALPGGPMYVNRGIIEAAHNEGELAGVMAHELSHVALRHGTAQATKAQKYQWGILAGAIAGAVIGGNVGQVIASGTQLGIGTYFLKFSREYEKEADLLGAQIMARAGYDPRDLANMFRTIEQQGGSGGPQWLSDHPNPGNRYAYINQEADELNVSSSPIKVTSDFRRVQDRLRGMPRARSMQEIASSGQPNNGRSTAGADSSYSRSVATPSGRYRTYRSGNFLSVNVPDNWREISGGSSVMFAPEGAYGQQGITRGVMFGVVQARSRGLQQAMDEYVSSLLQGNPYLRQQSGYQRTSLDNRTALGTVLAGTSPLTGRIEVVTVRTTFLRNGELFYFITITPQNESGIYNQAFQSMLRSLQLNG